MDSRLKIVLAPDSFKGSLTSTEAARAMARGVGKALPEAELVLLPLSDGGEGLVESLVVASGGELLEYEVTGPLGTPVKAQLGLMGGGETAGDRDGPGFGAGFGAGGRAQSSAHHHLRHRRAHRQGLGSGL